MPQRRKDLRNKENVSNIHFLRDSGWTYREIADKYQTTPKVIMNIINRKSKEPSVTLRLNGLVQRELQLSLSYLTLQKESLTEQLRRVEKDIKNLKRLLEQEVCDD